MNSISMQFPGVYLKIAYFNKVEGSSCSRSGLFDVSIPLPSREIFNQLKVGRENSIVSRSILLVIDIHHKT